MNTRLSNLLRTAISIVMLLSTGLPALAAAAPGATGQGPAAPQTTFQITGQVKDSGGAPLQGVMVKAALHTGSILVKDEGGNPVAGASVYTASGLLGVTAANGILASPAIQTGDRLAARVLKDEKPTGKYAHDTGALQNWGYRTYLTSVDVPKAGDPQGQLVTDSTLTQTLTIKKTNTLIGFNLLVTVEWDADSAFLTDLQQGFQKASAYLYDASDGQMLFENVDIYDDNVNAADADFYFQANNQALPRAAQFSLLQSTGRIDLGRYFSRASSQAGSWSSPDAYRTLVYAFSQYGLGLYDSGYGYDANLNRLNTACTSASVTSNISDTVNASLMFWRYNASEFSMNNVPGLWSSACQSTLQFQKNAHSDWETILNHFQDGQAPARWQILTPQDRAGVVPGPMIQAVPVWSAVAVAGDSATGVCATPISYQVKDELGSPVAGADVLLVKTTSHAIPQGKTDNLGMVDVLGAGNADLLVVNAWSGKFRTASVTIYCVALDPAASQAAPVLTLHPGLFDLSPHLLPGSFSQEISITIQSSLPLTMPVTGNFSQTGDQIAFQVGLTQAKDARHWAGTASLSPILAPQGVLYINAVYQSSTVELITDFKFIDIDPSVEQVVYSQDGLAELTLPANPAGHSGQLLVNSSPEVYTSTQAVQVISGPYTFALASGLTFPPAANLALSYQDPGGLLANLDKGSAHVARWDGAKWVLLTSAASSTTQTVSAVIDQPGMYALVVKPQGRLFVPLLSGAAPAQDAPAASLRLPFDPYAPQAPAVQASVVYSTATDANGFYTFTNITAGEYLVSSVQPGFSFSPAVRPVTPAGASGQDFTRLPASPTAGETVFIPAGSFQMGCDGTHNGGFSCQRNVTLHQVILDNYFISKYLVTTQQYAQCVTGGGCTPPANLDSGTRSPYYGNPLYANFPVIKVTWAQSQEYCAWAGGSLPTEAQWEKAARGQSPRSYPWGEAAPSCSLANSGNNGSNVTCLGNTSAVTATLGVSPYGAVDMAGNVNEWMHDVYDPLYYGVSPLHNPPGPDPVGTSYTRSIRGGSYLDSLWNSLLTGYRASAMPNAYFPMIGFRCQFPTP